MRLIGVTVNDNDFHSLFVNLLESIHSVIKQNFHTHKDIPEDMVKILIKSGLEYHYIAFQKRWDMYYKYPAMCGLGNVHQTIAYLHSKLKVYIDEEVEEILNRNDNNGEFFWLDISDGKVRCC